MMMFPVLFMVMMLLPVSTAQTKETRGGVDCRAYSSGYGPICSSDTTSLPRPGATLYYTITVHGRATVCCKAYTCRMFSCYMTYIGCGRRTWRSRSLSWAGSHTVATPKMQCKTKRVSSVSYSFVTTH